MAGGMSRRRGPTLAERRAVAAVAAVEPARSRPVAIRHCWVVGLPERPGRWAGLLAEWRHQDAGGRWEGRVVYAVDDGGTTVMVEAWVPAAHLEPAR